MDEKKDFMMMVFVAIYTNQLIEEIPAKKSMIIAQNSTTNPMVGITEPDSFFMKSGR